MSWIAIFVVVAFAASRAGANEFWSCYVAGNAGQRPLLVTFDVNGGQITETWASGTVARFDVMQNNRYGLVGFSSISRIETSQKDPTVGASAVVINKTNDEM